MSLLSSSSGWVVHVCRVGDGKPIGVPYTVKTHGRGGGMEEGGTEGRGEGGC